MDFVLDSIELQYASPAGAVALIDLTDNTEGSCASSSIAYAEGTARINAVITGKALVERVVAVSLDVDVRVSAIEFSDRTGTGQPEGAAGPLLHRMKLYI